MVVLVVPSMILMGKSSGPTHAERFRAHELPTNLKGVMLSYFHVEMDKLIFL